MILQRRTRAAVPTFKQKAGGTAVKVHRRIIIMSDRITYLTKENFETELTAGRPVIIDFYADWCGPCQMLAPIFDEMSEKYGEQVNFCKINIDEQKKLAVSNQVLSIPTMLFIKDGREVERVNGALTLNALEEKVQALL